MGYQFNPFTNTFDFSEAAAGGGGVTGTLTDKYIPKATGASTIADSVLQENNISPIGATLFMNETSQALRVVTPTNAGASASLRLDNATGELWSFKDDGDIRHKGDEWANLRGFATNSTHVGKFAGNGTFTGASNTGFGVLTNSAVTTGIGNVAIGHNANNKITTGNYCLAMGGANSNALTKADGFNMISIGAGSYGTQSSQLNFGYFAHGFLAQSINFGNGDGVLRSYRDMFLGEGGESATFLDDYFNIQPTEREAGAVDGLGKSLNLRAGRTTGAGVAGDLGFYTAPSGVAGSAKNAYVEAGKVDGESGSLLWNTDLEVIGNTNGLILESPNGTRHRITVKNSGALQVTSL